MDLSKVNFNGKIYGKLGNYSIYINNQKIEITDEDATAWLEQEKEKEEFLKNIPRVLHFVHTTKYGIGKEMLQHSIETWKQIMDKFQVHTLDCRTEQAGQEKTYQLQVATCNGQFEACIIFIDGREMQLDEQKFISCLEQNNKPLGITYIITDKKFILLEIPEEEIELGIEKNIIITKKDSNDKKLLPEEKIKVKIYQTGIDYYFYYDSKKIPIGRIWWESLDLLNLDTYKCNNIFSEMATKRESARALDSLCNYIYSYTVI